ncbi:FG-GAP repeat domain-containing protein [Streptomyces sp. NPDC058700]|uniref:FG-GAP repeat domain-containing protein n=1 Tax=Streptomyces sp. NPDC058700 TaxID=3346607 RepID=UPI00365F505C
MQYRSSTRLLAAVTAVVAVTAGTALTTVPATAAPVTAIQAPAQAAAAVTLPHPTEIVSAGATGYLTSVVYPSGTEYRWTDYVDGATKSLTAPRTSFMGAQSDIVFSREDREVVYWVNDMTSSDNVRYGLSHNDQRYALRGVAGETLVMSRTDQDTGVLDVNLLSRASGSTTIRDVTVIPGNARLGRVWASTPGIALLQYSTGTGAELRTFLVAVDTATGQAVDGPRQTHSEQTGSDAFVSRTHWAWIERTDTHRVQLVTAVRGVDAPEVTTDLGQASTGAPAPDMVARDASGVLWLYLGKGDGTFAGRTRIGSGWNAYNKITGGSDLNGDGWSDLLAGDTSGVLWAYQGTGNWSAPFRGRTKVGGGWGGMNQITAVGDVAGTPRGDLLARDTAGVLWLYPGATGSSFAARVRVGSGWGAYTHLVGVGDVDRDGRNDLFAYGKSGSFVYRGTGVAAVPFGPRESSSVNPATPTPRHPIV